MPSSSFVKRNENVINWLLSEDQPSVRYYALKDILGRKETDPEAKDAHAKIPREGWASEILKKQKPQGYFEKKRPIDPTPENVLSNPANFLSWLDFLYRPEFVATNHMALILSDLGLTSKDKRIGKIADLFFEYKLELGSLINIYNDEVCVVGNAARMLTRFGYADDHRVKKLFDRLVEDQKEDGGWHCFKSKKGTLDSWEALAAFAALPNEKRTKSIQRSIERGVEFYLERRLFKEGKRKYPPWFRFHYPNHYFYDILIGLDLVTRLRADDKRLQPALEILRKKRQSDGTWVLDVVHPDIGPGANYDLNVKDVIPFALEKPGEPSKLITLKALCILKRIEV